MTLEMTSDKALSVIACNVRNNNTNNFFNSYSRYNINKKLFHLITHLKNNQKHHVNNYYTLKVKVIPFKVTRSNANNL